MNQLSLIGLAFCQPISIKKPVLKITFFKRKTFKSSIFFSTIVKNKPMDVRAINTSQSLIYSTFPEHLLCAWPREFLQFSHFQMGGQYYFACVKCIGLYPNSILRKNMKVWYTQKGKGLRAVQIQVCFPSLSDAKCVSLGTLLNFFPGTDFLICLMEG